jgi:DNA-binding IclR family transcriptional regulator
LRNHQGRDIANPTEKPEQQGVQALETGLGVLEALVASGQPMMLKDIAHDAGVHPAKAHRYMVSFIRMGYVARDDAGRYRLGQNALRIGLACMSQMDPVRLATPYLDELCTHVEESVLAAVWGNFGPTVVLWRDALRPVSVNIRAGSVMPMLSSATGKVFSAFLDERFTDRLIAAELAEQKKRRGSHFPRTMEEVAQMRKAVREAGVATVTGDLRQGVNAVAAPVFDYEGRIVLVIAALGNERTFDPSEKSKLAMAVRRCAGALSRELGYQSAAPAAKKAAKAA